MQDRHLDRERYFSESAESSENYYIPFIRFDRSQPCPARILEIGCGEGGNLKRFAQMGCQVTGVDIVSCRIEQARQFFEARNLSGDFQCCDFMSYRVPETEAERFDVILLHDVIEHITDKEPFVQRIRAFLKVDGVLFVAFPAWYMPFGGHQQICRNKLWSKVPFLHLLPNAVYTFLLKTPAREKQTTIDELLYIKRCRTTVELFEKLVKRCGLRVVRRQLWLINPHYRQKFGLKPRKLSPILEKIPYVRNFLATSCFYLLRAS